MRLPVAEIPTIWLDRQAGVSTFRVAQWIPKYLHWYRFAFGRGSRPRRSGTGGAGPKSTHGAAVTGRRRNSKQMEKVLVSGSAGFIGGYVVEELLGRGYEVVGIDNFSKYGKVRKSYDDHPRYHFVEGDARDVDLMTKLLADCEHFIAGAAMIGGISYFHTYAYDLLATNERIIAASCDAAIAAHRDGRLRKVTYLSSSMVFESATTGRPTRARSGRSRRRCRPTDSRSWPWSTSPGPPATSTGSLHHRTTVQLRRHRREPGAGRQGDPVREREAGHEPRGPRPGAEGAQGSGPAAHPRLRRAGPALHLRR